METPIFVPTSIGNLAGVVSSPRDGRLDGRPVVWLPGGNNPRSRDPVSRATGLALARRGTTMLRLDYPGCGLSGGPRREDEVVAGAVSEVCDWWAEICDAGEIALGGSCRGAMIALAVAGSNPRISDVVAVSAPLRGRGRRKGRRRIRAGIAAVDPIGARMTSLLAGGGRDEGDDQFEWLPGMREAIEATRARLTFIYGSEDPAFPGFDSLKDSGFPNETSQKIRLLTREGAQLHGFKRIVDVEWMTDLLTELFTETASG